jgi:hypothetical protein
MSHVSLLMPITLQKWTSLMIEGMLFVGVGLRVLGDGEIARIDYLSASTRVLPTMYYTATTRHTTTSSRPAVDLNKSTM